MIDPAGKLIGHLFPDGYVYDAKGVSMGKIYSDGMSFITMFWVGRLSPVKLPILTAMWSVQAGYNGEVVNRFGEKLGRLDAKGMFLIITANIRRRAQTRAAIRLDGAFLGYSLTDGRVVDLDGKTVGRTSADGKILNSKSEVLGEVIPENIVIDIWGVIKDASTRWETLLI